MGKITPVGALVRGMFAGALGSAAQSVFFKVAAPLTPESPSDVFEPPEQAQNNESQTETVARRLVEKLAQRGPLEQEEKAHAAKLVHYGFGAMWGGLYGLSRESAPGFVDTPLGVAAFSAGVWALGDNALLALFRIAAPPQKYPVKVHAFALAAHLAYGAAVWGGYELMRPRSVAALAATAFALRKKFAVRRHVPRVLQPAAVRAIDVFAWAEKHRPIALA